MPITPTYPGIYIEELPSLSHSVTPAPTSITVFIGYTHPFQTPAANFGTPVEIFGPGDYQANFGGSFDLNPWLPDYLGNAVFQFFENGGNHAWVVGLKTTGFVDASGNPVKDAQGNQITLSPAAITFDISPSAAPSTVTVTLTARQPGGIDTANNNAASGTPTRVQLANQKKSSAAATDNDIADIIITYGILSETYRAVAAKDIATSLGQSALVTVTVNRAAASDEPGSFPGTLQDNGDLAYTVVPPANSTLVNPQRLRASVR